MDTILQRTIAALFLMELVCFTVFAQQVTRNDAIKAAENIIMDTNRNNGLRIVNNVLEYSENGNILIYEICFNTGTRVFVSGNKSCIPILGYTDILRLDSAQSVFDPFYREELPGGLVLLLEDYAQQIEYCFNHIVQNTNNRLWDSILQMKGSKSITSVYIPEMMTTRWGQWKSNDLKSTNIDRYAYNYLVPGGMTICTSHCMAGCGAVAMAQILKYWNYPQEYPAGWYQYLWNNMPAELLQKNNPNYSTQKIAVAKLISDCGVKSNIQYCLGDTTCSSGNNIYNAKNGLKLFGCSDVEIHSRGTNENSWISQVFNELLSDRPIYYTAFTSSSLDTGHAFVCDGCIRDDNSNYLFHFNWGWNGDGNGYYTIGNLNPSVSFNYYHSAIFNIYPTDCWLNIIMECDKGFSSGVSRFYSAENDIRNNNHQYIVYNGASVQLQAGNEILLTNGFDAQEGSIFTAVIGSCPAPSNRYVPSGNNEASESETANDRVDTLKSLSNSKVDAHTGASQQNITVHPNPTDNVLHVSVTDGEIARIEMFDMFGRGVPVETQNFASLPSPTTTVNTSDIPTGLYVLRVTLTNGTVRTTKVMKR